ncbi:hypothetical protein E6C76_20090 [Pseudothauera nasutitermitis]|uniref:Uncharacterized protein n=1 Tax=Pseudothauera nasutitermitis TaxID=2565930 RepID=A0A4S4AP08_9RHOO|nr:hypothetical protein [Pseudothauera nasutitermitis]THF61388.1 hypothetical protein E6C76_20090 [Pseudothauera nasutitermitis]
MDISPAHAVAVMQAIRNPALQARLALLHGDTENRATLEFHGGTYPDPPGSGTPTPLAVLTFPASAGTVDEDEHMILLASPLEALVTGADPVDGTIPIWARLRMPGGDWWGDLTVSVEGEGGEVQLVQTAIEGGVPVVRWFNGAPARLATMTIQG